MSNTKTILEVPEMPALLKHDILSGKAIVFIGAGLSKLAGMPTWKELAQKRLEEVRRRNLISYETYCHLLDERPLKTLSICESFLEGEKLHECLCNNQNREKALKLATLLSPFDLGFVTTNYDSLLEAVPIEKFSNPEVVSDKPQTKTGNSFILEESNFDIFLANPKHKVYYLHGKDSSESNPPICTLNDYLRHYRQGGRGRRILEDLCAKKSILFIGVNLEEFEILEHLHISRYENQHYALVPMFSYEGNILEKYQAYYSILNIEILPYNISKNGYEQLENVLKVWGNVLRQKKDSSNDISKRLKNNALIDEVSHGLD